jgi:hypothetical protein
MNRLFASTLVITSTIGLAVLLGSDALAQQRQHVSFKVPAEHSKYSVQQDVDIRDVSNHLVRIFEVHRTFSDNPPVINGLKITEAWDSGVADRIDGSGPLTQYSVYLTADGDKFFARLDGMAQQASPGKFTANVFGPITGGTGKFIGIQGTVRLVATFEPRTGFNENQVDIEYSMVK